MKKKIRSHCIQLRLTSGLILPSANGPRPENPDTSSMVLPTENLVIPDFELPTAKEFLPVAGVVMLHKSVDESPLLPAAKTRRCLGFS